MNEKAMPAGVEPAGDRKGSCAEQFHPELSTTRLQTLPFRTAAEIRDLSAARLTWRCTGLLADGNVSLLTGAVKRSGKTTLVTHLCAAILEGREFLGFETRPCEVIYLTEQGPASFREALRRANLLDRADLHVLSWHDTLREKWSDVVQGARNKAKETGARVLIVDTLPQFSGLSGDAENNAGAALEACRPLQEAASADGLAVLATGHDRKAGGVVGEAGRGSSAFPGSVDVVLQLVRGEGNVPPTVRALSGLSRFDETPEALVIDLTPEGYVSRGTGTAVVAQAARAALLDIMPTDEAAALAEEELIARAEVSRATGRRMLANLLDSAEIVRIGSGRRGDPYRFWLTDQTGNPSKAERETA